MVSGPWQRWAHYVARHPKSLTLGALAVIVLIIVPFFSLQLGSSDAGTDPTTSTTRLAYDLLAQGFGPGFNGPLDIVGAIKSPRDKATMNHLDTMLKGKPGVAEIEPLFTNPKGTVGVIQLTPTTSPQSTKTTDLINEIRNTYIPASHRDLAYQDLRRRHHRDLRGLRVGPDRQASAVRGRDRLARVACCSWWRFAASWCRW